MKNVYSILIMLLFVAAGCGESKPPTDDLITVDVTANYPKKNWFFRTLWMSNTFRWKQVANLLQWGGCMPSERKS